eukprot:gene21291-28218_t
MKVELPGVLSRSSSDAHSDRGKCGSPAPPTATPTAATAPQHSTGRMEEVVKIPEYLWSMSDELTAQHYKTYMGGRVERQSNLGSNRLSSDFVTRWLKPNSPVLPDTLGGGVEGFRAGATAGVGVGVGAVVSSLSREVGFVSDRGVPGFPSSIDSDRTANSPPPGKDAEAGRRELERSATEPRVQLDHLSYACTWPAEIWNIGRSVLLLPLSIGHLAGRTTGQPTPVSSAIRDRREPRHSAVVPFATAGSPPSAPGTSEFKSNVDRVDPDEELTCYRCTIPAVAGLIAEEMCDVLLSFGAQSVV